MVLEAGVTGGELRNCPGLGESYGRWDDRSRWKVTKGWGAAESGEVQEEVQVTGDLH